MKDGANCSRNEKPKCYKGILSCDTDGLCSESNNGTVG